MTVLARIGRRATVALGVTLAVVAFAPVHLQAQAATETGWNTRNSTPDTSRVFQCIYHQKWPCDVPPDGAPTVDQILAKYEEALGGAKALARVHTRVVTQRRFQDVGAPEDHYLLRYTKEPPVAEGRLLSIQSHTALDGTFLRWSNGCDAKGGYSWSGRKDPSGIPHEGKNSTDGLCEQELYFYGYFPLDLAHLKRAYRRLEYKGVHKIFQPTASAVGDMAGGEGPDIIPAGQARDTYLLLAVPAKAGDDYQWLYFDVKTGLLLRFASAGDNPNWPNSPLAGSQDAMKLASAGNTARIVDLIQYRKVGDGTVEPFQFVNQGPDTRVRGVTVNVLENAPLDDRVFLRPKNSLRSDKGFGVEAKTP